jgi:hypothetical protein
MDGLLRFERLIKIMVAVISLVGLAFLGLRVRAGKSFRVDVQQECEAAGRVYDAAQRTCLSR